MPHAARRNPAMLLIAFASLTFMLPCGGVHAQARPLELALPTANRALFGSDPSRFYMYTNRSFEGRQSRPWQGGKYGYVRNPKRTREGIVYSRFHEGVDIRPAARDRAGNPLDTVRAISTGVVVYCNDAPGASSYGRYVVVEHNWGYGKFYSLYAHLAAISARTGQAVRPGTALGKLGYTGAGIDRTRAHLHLELNLMLSPGFSKWHDLHYTSPNRHGIYNGLNLAGIDIAGLYHAHRRNPGITIPQFVSRMQVYFKVLVPNKGLPDVVRFYPWMARGMAGAKGNPSWELSLSSSGVPLSVAPSGRSVRAATVSWVRYSSLPHSWNTRSRLTGSGNEAALSSSGRRYIQLLVGDF